MTSLSSTTSQRDLPTASLPTQRAPVATDWSLVLAEGRSERRRALESSIARKFERAYGAQLKHFLPAMLSLCAAGEPAAVVGIRAARQGELFLEQYLDMPVEQAIASRFLTPVDRAQVVEIGNLAAEVPGLACSLFAVLAMVLDRAGYRWVACTATPQVSAMLAKMNFSAEAICNADPARLQDGTGDWGDYYASRPRVIVGDVASAAARVAADDVGMAALVRRFRRPIAAMAASLRSHRFTIDQ